MKRYIATAFMLLAFIVLSFVLSNQTVTNTSETLAIIFKVILPTLFPLIILTLLFIELGGVELLAYIFQYPAKIILGISGSGFCALLSGLIGGSPLGAIVLHELLDKKMISINEGQKLFNIAAFISPGFILVSLSTLKNFPYIAISYYLSIFLILILSGFIYKKDDNSFDFDFLVTRLKERYNNFSIAASLVKVIKNAGLSLLIISGTMVLFNLPYVFMRMLFNEEISFFISGIFEFSKSSIVLISKPNFTSHLVVIAILSWGGLAMMLQNLAYKYHYIKIKPYIITRVFQIILSCFLLYLFHSF